MWIPSHQILVSAMTSGSLLPSRLRSSLTDQEHGRLYFSEPKINIDNQIWHSKLETLEKTSLLNAIDLPVHEADRGLMYMQTKPRSRFSPWDVNTPALTNHPSPPNFLLYWRDYDCRMNPANRISSLFLKETPERGLRAPFRLIMMGFTIDVIRDLQLDHTGHSFCLV